MSGARWLSVLASALLVACGGAPSITHDDGGADGVVGADAGVDGAGIVIAEPAPVVPAALTPCAAGWREVTDASGLVTCDPWPVAGRRSDCAYDEAHFAGEPGCARVGTACAVDGWPVALPAGRTVVFVDDDAVAGGDGAARDRAFRSIVEAVTAAPDGAVIAVAAGRYDEDVVLTRGLMLLGACVFGTRLTSSRATDADLASALEVGDGCTARDLSLDAPERNGLIAHGAGARIEDVVVNAARIDAVLVTGGAVEARSVVVRGTRPSSTGAFGRGVEVDSGHLLLARAVVESGAEDGLFASGAGTWLECEDVAIEDSQEVGAWAQRGARLTLKRAALERNHKAGLAAVGASMEATDVVVRETEPVSDGTLGRGAEVLRGGTLRLVRALFERNRDAGLLAGESGTQLDASDVVVRDTSASADGTRGRGVDIEAGAAAMLARVVLDANHEFGLLVDGVGTDVRAESLVVRGTDSIPDGTVGIGVEVAEHAHLALVGALVDANREAGVFAIRSATLDASDLVVSGTLPNRRGEYGIGVVAQREASVTLARVSVARSVITGLLLLEAAVAHASDLRVAGVSSGCFVPGCAAPSGGFGLAVHSGGTLTVDQFAVGDTAVCGIVIGPSVDFGPSGLDLSNGSVANAPIGACIQVDGYDVSRLSRLVEYRDVGVPLQATTYELPTPMF